MRWNVREKNTDNENVYTNIESVSFALHFDNEVGKENEPKKIRSVHNACIN